jgi:AraC-like DNA-binding protein
VEPTKQLFREIQYPGSTGCFKVLTFEQDVQETTDGATDLGTETWALVVKRQGTTLYKADEHQHPVVVPANTVVLCRSRSVRMRVTKGSHASTIVLWKASSLPKLAASFEKSKRFLAAQSIFPLHDHSMKLLNQLVTEPNKNFELTMIGVLYSTIGVMISRKDEINLSSIDHSFPESMRPLLEMVRKDPSKYWPVPEAANIVGYSAHHFSRVFKQYSGMRFQDFVERCRTSQAIDLLVSTKLSVDTVATKTGFGAPQALRDAFKEILGIMPSDLRGFH